MRLKLSEFSFWEESVWVYSTCYISQWKTFYELLLTFYNASESKTTVLNYNCRQFNVFVLMFICISTISCKWYNVFIRFQILKQRYLYLALLWTVFLSQIFKTNLGWWTAIILKKNTTLISCRKLIPWLQQLFWMAEF
jgi:hypothetical protein